MRILPEVVQEAVVTGVAVAGIGMAAPMSPFITQQYGPDAENRGFPVPEVYRAG
jgi:hypothetical protein